MSQPIAPLAEALLREIDRVRDNVLPTYMACGESGAPGEYLVRLVLDAAAKAIIEDDIVDMHLSYITLKEIIE